MTRLTAWDPHDNPATRWEIGPDGEWTIVPLWDGKPGWLRDGDEVRFNLTEPRREAGCFTTRWNEAPAFFLRRRPQAQLVAQIRDVLRAWDSSRSWQIQAETIARTMLAAGWRKGDAP